MKNKLDNDGLAVILFLDDYTDTVYPYVSVEIAQEELELHGGIVEGRLPE